MPTTPIPPNLGQIIGQTIRRDLQNHRLVNTGPAIGIVHNIQIDPARQHKHRSRTQPL